MLESNDPEPGWGLCDHGPLLPADYRDDEEDYDEEWDDYDDESEVESLARLAGSAMSPAHLRGNAHDVRRAG